MFSKAKLKRFNEEVGCAPPPTAYNPKAKDGASAAVSMDKSQRWKNTSEETPGPGAYCTERLPSTSPLKKRTTSTSRLNSSTLSTSSAGSSASSASVFISPGRPRALTRSTSTRTVKGHPGDHTGDEAGELQMRLGQLSDERDQMKAHITHLQSQLDMLTSRLSRRDLCDKATGVEEELTKDRKSGTNENGCNTLELGNSNQSTPRSSPTKTVDCVSDFGEVSTLMEQLGVVKKELSDAQQVISTLTDERSGLQLKLEEIQEKGQEGSVSEESATTMREEVVHLTQLRDNLEASLLVKEDLIAELQLQLDEVVAEATTVHFQVEQYQVGVAQLQQKLEETLRCRSEAEGRVRDMVARYESLVVERDQQRHHHQETIAKKDIEIQLLNTSLTNLNSKISEYEVTMSILEEEICRVSVLEATVSELSLAAKERELTDTMHQEELNSRYQEVTKLEETINEVSASLSAAKSEKEELSAKLAAVTAEKEELCIKLEEATAETNILVAALEEEKERAKALETEVKEKEVVQQFLEKEMAAREAELTESSLKIREIERELETARGVALDLQQDAEVQLNQVLTLKATISAKDYDLEAKSDLITTLQEEMSNRQNETSALHEKYEDQISTVEQMEEMLTCKEEQLCSVMEELGLMRGNLRVKEDKLTDLKTRASDLQDVNRQLEERIVELMAEISDREAQHIDRMSRIETDLDDLGVKYSEALLEQEATRRVLTHTTEQLEHERLVRAGAEGDLQGLKEEHAAMEINLRDLVQKYTSLEDALACEEGENRDLEERLERQVCESQLAATTAQKEMDSLVTSNTGFCTQIMQLKMDMRKKGEAVKEMQQCIEGLREERQHLTNLRDNLETTLTARDDTIDQLRLMVTTVEREGQEDRVTLQARLADLENNLKETQDEINTKTEKVRELEGKVSSLEEENLKLTKTYEQQLQEKIEATTQLTASLDNLNTQLDGYKDQLNNLETSLLDKTKELESHKLEMTVNLETTANRLRQEVDHVNTSLMDKTIAMDALTTTLSTTQDQLQALQKSIAEKEAALSSEQQRVKKLESEGQELAKQGKESQKTVQHLQESLDKTKEELSSVKALQNEVVSTETSRLTQQWEEECNQWTSVNATLTEELNSWKNKFLHLEKIIEPFREQLDSYEVEKASLLERSSAAKEEVDKLGKQYARLLGHQNHKQKIQHVLQLKTENGHLKEEVHKLRQEGERQRKTMRRLEEKMSRIGGSTTRLHDSSRSLGDKENTSTSFLSASTSSLALHPPAASTPLRSSNRPHRL